jgi:Type IV secretion-system coupling protein DNA-binding domain
MEKINFPTSGVSGILYVAIFIFLLIVAPYVLSLIALAATGYVLWQAKKNEDLRKKALFLVGLPGLFGLASGLWGASRTQFNVTDIPTVGMVLVLFATFFAGPGAVVLAYRNLRFGIQPRTLRGAELTTPKELQKLLDKKITQDDPKPQLQIAGIKIARYLEPLNFFFVGSPGSGKTASIVELLYWARQRDDFRGLILDRNGELTEKFFDPNRDILFNPEDARSVGWCHAAEQARAETMAAALISSGDKDDVFFDEAARSLLADLFERCSSNAEVWHLLAESTIEELQGFVKGGLSSRYFVSEKTAGSILSTLVNRARFFYYLQRLEREQFSFLKWGKSNDVRWIFLPIFENDSELYKPLYSCVFELALRGLLSDENRALSTLFVADELGALNKLQSLSRVLAEGRKFKVTAALGTQTDAQIDKIYGENDRRILLQSCKTKLILNCPDNKTAETMAEVIGKREQIDVSRSQNKPMQFYKGKSENIRETYAVLPTELMALPPLEGYLAISDENPTARVKVIPRSDLPPIAERLVPYPAVIKSPVAPTVERKVVEAEVDHEW